MATSDDNRNARKAAFALAAKVILWAVTRLSHFTPRSVKDPLKAGRQLGLHVLFFRRGHLWNAQWNSVLGGEAQIGQTNPLREHFNNLVCGPGIWKWDHYFDVYHRYFKKFVNREVHILEIGVYSGGSLLMWKQYFGENCHIYGVDVEQDCKVYEDDSTRIFIGDQANRQFWRSFKEQVPKLDIVVDDGGHKANQQIVSLEELLPHLRPGGIYVCEDLETSLGLNGFTSYVNGLTHSLNMCASESSPENNERRIVTRTTFLPSAIRSVHIYPFVTVIEKREAPVAEFVAPKHGSMWQPFLR